LRQCSGTWIAPCDQDDVWRPDKIERLLDVAGDATLVYSDSELIDAEGKSLQTRVSDRLTMIDGSDPRLFALANCVSGHAMLLRRGLLERALPLPDVSFHDWWLAFVAANIGTIRYLDEPLVQFRQHPSNVSAFTGGQDRKRSSERAKHAARQRDFDALASFQGPQQAFFRSLASAWAERPRRAFTPRARSGCSGAIAAWSSRARSARRVAPVTPSNTCGDCACSADARAGESLLDQADHALRAHLVETEGPAAGVLVAALAAARHAWRLALDQPDIALLLQRRAQHPRTGTGGPRRCAGQGPQAIGCDGPNRATVGVPVAAARWVTEVSGPTNSRAPSINGVNAANGSAPPRSATWARWSAERPSTIARSNARSASADPPVRRTSKPRSIRWRVSARQPSRVQAL
jgi:hypothetical protein